MTKILSKYNGKYITESKHEDSGEIIYTDAPKDNKGEGKYFSPTDLVATALADCILTTIGILYTSADITGMTAKVEKIMSKDLPRKIASIVINFYPNPNFEYTQEDRINIERIAHTCPVALSLSQNLEQVVKFHW